jgi:hypothetical protein
MPRTLTEAVAAVLPDTLGGWVALAGESLLSGLLSPFTWAALLGGGLLALSCGFMEGKPLPRLLSRTRK